MCVAPQHPTFQVLGATHVSKPEFKRCKRRFIPRYCTGFLRPGVDGNGEHVTAETLKKAAQRILVSHMRLGFYDAHTSSYPYRNLLLDNRTWAALDGPAHRAVAREAAASNSQIRTYAPLCFSKWCRFFEFGDVLCFAPNQNTSRIPCENV